MLPLSKKLGDKAMEIRNELSKYFMVDYDDTGSIGKRYRREDEIGTPYCITVDFDTVGDEAKGIAADTASPSATVIPWSRCVCPSPSSRAISRARSSSDPNKNSPAVAISAGLWYLYR